MADIAAQWRVACGHNPRRHRIVAFKQETKPDPRLTCSRASRPLSGRADRCNSAFLIKQIRNWHLSRYWDMAPAVETGGL